MSDTKETPMPYEGCCAAALLFGMPLWFMWSAWVDVKLWSWFAVPLGAPMVGLGHMVGLGLLVRSLTSQVRRKTPTSAQVLSAAIFGPPVYLLAGWLTLMFMGAR